MTDTPDGITVEMTESCEDIVEDGGLVRLKHLKNWPPANINFQDVTQTVPDVTCGKRNRDQNIWIKSVGGIEKQKGHPMTCGIKTGTRSQVVLLSCDL